MRASRRLAAVLLCGLLTAACGGVGDNESQEFLALVERIESQDLTSYDSLQQELVAECMKLEGFEYVPYVATDPPTDSVSGGDAFGIAERYRDPDTSQNPPPNPNDLIFEALSNTERNAYQDALFGVSDRGSGCQEVRPEGFEELEAYFINTKPLLDEYVHTHLAGDSRVVSSIDQWSQCMSANGFDFESPDAMLRELEALAFESIEDLDTFAEFEVLVADAHHGCQDPHLSDVEDIRREYVADFLSER